MEEDLTKIWKALNELAVVADDLVELINCESKLKRERLDHLLKRIVALEDKGQ